MARRATADFFQIEQAAAGCYTVAANGLPARIELGDSVRVTSEDSAAFRAGSWSPSGTDSVRIALKDSTGEEYRIAARVYPNGLRGRVMSDSGLTVKPFAAKRCPK
jgi:hypothetical protein